MSTPEEARKSIFTRWVEKYPPIPDLPRSTVPRAAFSKVPETVEPWYSLAQRLEAEIQALQELLDEMQEHTVIYVDNPEYDPDIAAKYFPRTIRIGQSYNPFDPDVPPPAVFYTAFGEASDPE